METQGSLAVQSPFIRLEFCTVFCFYPFEKSQMMLNKHNPKSTGPSYF